MNVRDLVLCSILTQSQDGKLLLKGFKRIHLKAGESKEVIFDLNYDSFKLMDIRYNWTVEPGKFRILVGAASNDIRLEGEVTL